VRGSSGTAAALSFLSNSNVLVTNNLEISKDLDVDGHTNLDNTTVAGITTFTNVVTKFKASNGGNTHLQILSTGSGEAGIFFDAANGDISGSDYAFIGQQNNLDFVIKANPNAGNIDFQRGTDTKVRIDTSGNLNVNYDLDVDGHTNLDNVSVAGITTFSDNVSFTTANGNGIIISKSSNYMMFGNSVTQYFGGSSMWLMHNGSTGYLHNVTGSLYIRNQSAGDIYIQGKSGENSIICNDDGNVQLYNDNVIRFNTTATGVTVHA
ncbi:MAG: hypothetical protein VXY93_14410, partial [Pseudomonadota bacterium]|nr:hypothetical protein [Pseudomonadota bacterium]